ncbi:hypothetical protein [Pseudoalteromonas nigrifaciens]|uniref:hypothetical protein n=1 Tax=Pseudoalteromonas nigrifaciens TaxID=28109 RepID=UPI003FD1557A
MNQRNKDSEMGKERSDIFNVVMGYFDRLGVSFILEDFIKSIRMSVMSPRKKQIAYLIQFDVWVADGANLLDAVRELRIASIKQGNKNSFEVRASNSIERALVNGNQVSDGMKQNFSEDLVSLFKIGEEAESVREMFGEYIKQESERKAVFKSGVGKLLQPIGLLLFTISILIGLNDYGMPLANQYGINLERLTGIPSKMVNLASKVSFIWPYIFFFMVASFVIYKMTRDYYVKKFLVLPSREFLDKFFPYSIHKEFVAMGVVQKIGLLSKMGMPINACVKVLSKSATPYELKYYERIRRNATSSTGTVADYLDVDLLNTEVFQRLSGIAKQEGANSKVKAILAASRENGVAAKRSLSKMMLSLRVFLWVLFTFMGGITALGLVLLTFQLNNIISIN